MTRPRPSAQRGIVLVVALLLLLVLTIIGLAATQGTWLQLKMASNNADRNLAFQAAEAALVNCQKVLDQDPRPAFTLNGDNGYYLITSTNTDPAWQQTDWTDAHSRAYDGDLDLVGTQGASAAPRCVFAQLPATSNAGGGLSSDNPNFKLMYRITARGIGASANTVIMLQATYEK